MLRTLGPEYSLLILIPPASALAENLEFIIADRKMDIEAQQFIKEHVRSRSIKGRTEV